MILKLSLTILLLYYLVVLWKYYRQDIAGIFGTAETDEDTEGTGKEPGQPGEPYTVMGESTYLPFAAEDDGADYSDIECNLQIFLCLFLEKLNMPQNTPVTKAS